MRKHFCSQCGNMIVQSANFCQYCGAAQVATHPKDKTTVAQVAAEVAVASTQKTAEVDKAVIKQYPLAFEVVEIRRLSPLALIAFMANYVVRTWPIALIILASLYFDFLLAIVACLAYVAIIVLIAVMAWSSFYFAVDETSFQNQYGIFHKYNVTIPFSQIQNVNISRSIFNQLLGLASIDIETAGDARTTKKNVIGGSLSKAEGHLPGISVREAEKIHDILLQKVAVSQK